MPNAPHCSFHLTYKIERNKTLRGEALFRCVTEGSTTIHARKMSLHSYEDNNSGHKDASERFLRCSQSVIHGFGLFIVVPRDRLSFLS